MAFHIGYTSEHLASVPASDSGRVARGPSPRSVPDAPRLTAWPVLVHRRFDTCGTESAHKERPGRLSGDRTLAVPPRYKRFQICPYLAIAGSFEM